MENLTIEANEIKKLAAEILAAEKLERAKLESERIERVQMLIDTIFELNPDSSASIEKELNDLAKAKDFCEHFVLIKSGFVNFCYYDGKDITTYKENGQISVKSLPFKVFVSKFNCHWLNYFKDSEVSGSWNGKSAKDLFESWKNNHIGTFCEKGSNSIDTNKATIHCNKLQNIGLTKKNSLNRKVKK